MERGYLREFKEEDLVAPGRQRMTSSLLAKGREEK
jgi:hypothetical protein